MLAARLREHGLSGTLRFGARLARVGLRRPTEALDHLQTQVALTRAQPPAPVDAPEEWHEALHDALDAPWPCTENDDFRRLWDELMRELAAEASVGVGHDADPTLSEAVWCIVRHRRPRVILETGVSRGITSRVILEALARNGDGRLWSIDLPPLEDPWRRLARSAVPERLRDGWTYVRGASTRRLPRLLPGLGQIDLFVHDSLHTEENLRFELQHVWPSVRPAGLVVIDDVEACRAFEHVVPSLGAATTILARHRFKSDAIAIAVKPSH